MKSKSINLLSIVCVLLLSLSNPLVAKDTNATDLSGTWEFSVLMAGSETIMMVELVQEGENVSGTSEDPYGEAIAMKGNNDGEKILIGYTSDWQGNEMTVTYVGKLNSQGSIVGSAEVQPFGITGEFIAKRIPKAE